MGLEAATYINQLNSSWPVGGVDPVAQGDDHLRMIKATLQTSFPNITGAMVRTHTELNALGAFTGFAAPTVKAKATGAAGAGAATTALRSDIQMLIDLADAYAWTGAHSFAYDLQIGSGGPLGGAPALASGGELYCNRALAGMHQAQVLNTDTGATSAARLIVGVNGAGQGNGAFIGTSNAYGEYLPGSGVTGRQLITHTGQDTPYVIGTFDVARMIFAGNGAYTISRTQFRFSNGTVGAPSISSEFDTDTGWYFNADNTLRAATGGNITLYLDSTNSRIIPYYPLQKNGNDTAGAPSYSWTGDTASGFYYDGIAVAGSFAGVRVMQMLGAANGGLLVVDYGGTLQHVGFRNIPQNSQSANYTAVLADSGKHIFHPSGGGAGDTFTIPANSSVAYAVGTALTFVNRDSNAVSIAITTDTMTMAGTTSAGTRTLAQNGIATALKVGATDWLISGTGLS